MYPIKQSTAETILFFAHDVNGDAVTGMVDGGFTKRISKGSGAFAAMTVTITEMENGWYSFPLSTTHSDTLGLLTISLSNASCKRINLQWRVSARTLDELASPTNITAGTITTVTNLTNLPTITAGWLTATGIAASALNGKGDWNIGKTGYALTATTGLGNQTSNITGNLSGSVGSVTGLTASNLDVAVSTIPTATQNADALLNRDMSAVSDTNARSPLNALRFLRNKWSVAAGTLTVTKENDSTSAWTAAISTDAAAVPVIGSDPA